jgi:hypothetical protein
VYECPPALRRPEWELKPAWLGGLLDHLLDRQDRGILGQLDDRLWRQQSLDRAGQPRRVQQTAAQLADPLLDR